MSATSETENNKHEGSSATAIADAGIPPSRELSYKGEIIGGILAFLLIHSVLLFPTYHGDHFDAGKMGVFGDFIGGYVGQLIALTGVCFLIATFRTEYARAKRERFENRYFELLRLHRDNVEEMELGPKAKGRKIFVLLIREWRCIMNVVRRLAQDLSEDLTQLQLIQIAYYFLYYGVGPNSTRMVKASLANFDKSFIDAVAAKLSPKDFKREVRLGRKLEYTPFEGHQSRLGHYYRHLFQMVRYVEANIPPQLAVKEYMGTIRAQLSTHEQALLLLNSLTPIGAAWWNLKLIDDHFLVHNIPKQFFHPKLEVDTYAIFEPGYFERPETHAKTFETLVEPFPRFVQRGAIWRDGRHVTPSGLMDRRTDRPDNPGPPSGEQLV